MPKVDLPYAINDADNHFNEPPDLYERFIDPSQRDLAIRFVTDADGRKLQLFAGRPSKFDASQVTYSADELTKMLGDVPDRDENEPESAGRPLPGMLLNRLNPLKGLSDDDRKEVIAQFREQREAYGNRDVRLALMDDQGIDKALMYPASAHDIEFEFADDLEALYANVRAFNRWIHEEIGYAYKGRMFLPPYLALADVDLALAELEILIETGAPMVQFKSGHAHGGRDNPSAAARSPTRCSTRSGPASTRPACAWPCTSGPPTTRSTAPTGARTPRSPSAGSTPSSGSCTGVTVPRWS